MQIVIAAAPQGMLDTIFTPSSAHTAQCCPATAAADNMAAEEEKCGAL